jgi:hypothetical protein
MQQHGDFSSRQIDSGPCHSCPVTRHSLIFRKPENQSSDREKDSPTAGKAYIRRVNRDTNGR